MVVQQPNRSVTMACEVIFSGGGGIGLSDICVCNGNSTMYI